MSQSRDLFYQKGLKSARPYFKSSNVFLSKFNIEDRERIKFLSFVGSIDNLFSFGLPHDRQQNELCIDRN